MKHFNAITDIGPSARDIIVLRGIVVSRDHVALRNFFFSLNLEGKVTRRQAAKSWC